MLRIKDWIMQHIPEHLNNILISLRHDEYI